MTFTFLSTIATLAGILSLALALVLLQRLRVQHREIEVVSTLFWQAAVKETRARVFIKEFRHWPAWLLLVLIASALWVLLAGPRWSGNDQMQHVVLLDGSISDPSVSNSDLALATEKASKLPIMNREIIHAGPRLETLLRPGEPVQLAQLRWEAKRIPSSTGLEWALDALSSRVAADQPLTVHVIGDAEFDDRFLDGLPAELTVYRIDRGPRPEKPLLRSLGLSSASSGVWQNVDVLFSPENADAFQITDLELTLDTQPIANRVVSTNDGNYIVEGVPARGGIFRLSYQNSQVGALTLPKREPIKILFESTTPKTLKDLVLLDPACIEVTTDADLVVGPSDQADLCLVSDAEAAFQIDTEIEDAESALNSLIDELALRQIDATGLAEQSGRVVDVRVAVADSRRISLWRNLFTSTYNFQQSRACPIFVARSIRWLAGQPELVPWAEQGMRLPEARPVFDRISGSTAQTNDGRNLQVTRLTRPTQIQGLLADSPSSSVVAGVGVAAWIGAFAILLLLAEWTLFQKGRMP